MKIEDRGACVSSDRKDNRQPTLELTGTTLKVYRYLYRAGKPCGIHDIRRGLNLSSSSVALYHVRKLLDAGMIREQTPTHASNQGNDLVEEGSSSDGIEKGTVGYVVDKVLFDNMIRIRRSLIPVQVGYAIFFATALAVLLLLLRPAILSGAYLFAIIIIAIAVGIFSYQAIRTASRTLLP